jgi:hypothetical protein
MSWTRSMDKVVANATVTLSSSALCLNVVPQNGGE